MEADTNELIEHLSQSECPDIRRRAATPIWDLVDPPLLAPGRGRRMEALGACKAELLSGVVRGDRPAWIRHADAPADEGVPGTWRQAAPNTWSLPADFDPAMDAARGWLMRGNWTVYRATHPIAAGWPDIARVSGTDLLQWMQQHGVEALIDAWHDDVSWVVAVAGESSPT